MSTGEQHEWMENVTRTSGVSSHRLNSERLGLICVQSVAKKQPLYPFFDFRFWPAAFGYFVGEVDSLVPSKRRLSSFT